jgi:hypothetical protein
MNAFNEALLEGVAPLRNEMRKPWKLQTAVQNEAGIRQ